MTILSVQNVTKKYKNHVVLDDVSLNIDRPGIWALVGPNGVGKTTFLNVITNILSADSGTIELIGKSNKDHTVFKDVSFLQDNTILFDYLTGDDHLKYICDVHQLPRKRAQEIAEYVGMENYLDKTVGNYSLGMKQHLLLAMALVNDPKLLFLDEPLNGLDPTSAILMRKILIELADKGTTIILSSHNLAEIDRVTQQIIFLKDGKLIEENMGDHEKTYYMLRLSDLKKAKDLLDNQNYSANIDDDFIQLELEEGSLDKIIDIIKAHDIQIFDIQKNVTGSENLYEKIFEV